MDISIVQSSTVGLAFCYRTEQTRSPLLWNEIYDKSTVVPYNSCELGSSYRKPHKKDKGLAVVGF